MIGRRFVLTSAPAMKNASLPATALLAVALVGCHRPADPKAWGPTAPAATPAAAAHAAPPKPVVDEGPPPPRGKEITLLFSSNLHGEYEPCG